MQDKEEFELRLRLLKRRALFGAIFVVGTLLAAIGWFTEWKGLNNTYWFLEDYLTYTIVGHALQVVAVFGYLITPDEFENDSRSGE